MSGETKFGERILHVKPSAARIIRRAILFLIPAVGLVGLGITGFLRPDILDMQGEEWMVPVLLGAGLLYFVFMIFFLKPYEAVVYAQGLEYKRRGANFKQIAFSDLDITDAIERSYIFMVIPFRRVRRISLDGVHTFYRSNTPNFHHFANTLVATHREYLVKDLTPENINQAAISFGPMLKLRDGKLMFNESSKKEKIIPLGDVFSVEVFNAGAGNDLIALKGAPDEGGRSKDLFTITATSISNLEVLEYVIEVGSKEEKP